MSRYDLIHYGDKQSIQGSHRIKVGYVHCHNPLTHHCHPAPLLLNARASPSIIIKNDFQVLASFLQKLELQNSVSRPPLIL